ncbi:glutamate synthase subunit beta [Robertkochia marina]|uniref:Glutamate synthase subunit beta n=1 Tax=Robertkochia marina TaxID=1227945 RepID=A0A4S3M642_9FLAO|nr:glutamate synthase subunit beta [Robertkochia marina]THD69861.1 glutamate synthase subunit beta [Robertkochia marina]TRZ46794.1 glutamate synthase subunit beta [Robertkochia marina]
MGKLRGFLEYERTNETLAPVKERVHHYHEFTIAPSETALKHQGGRCMDCGIPFCHSGCPLGNLIPDFNDAVYNNHWKKALELLHATNNFPEFTGRLCPAPCESACVLGIVKAPVAIELIEKTIVERGFSEGWIQPDPPENRTGKTVAVIGSGPAGLAAAQQLNRAGHVVTVFERDDQPGGLLRYGIPDFKLEKHLIDRRIDILKQEGIEFITGKEVGKDLRIEDLNTFDAILLSGGATKRRQLPVRGSDAKGVIQAMDYLKHKNKCVQKSIPEDPELQALNKHVIVIGGGDTGSDCVGTANRQGAASVTNFEIMPLPPGERTDKHPWPYWPFTLKTTTSHEEGCEREWSIMTKEFISDASGNLKSLVTVDVRWEEIPGEAPTLTEIEDSEREWPCDMALLALGFTGPEHTLPELFNVTTDSRSNIKGENYQTNIPHIFTAGDMRRGQSLIVWAISEGREAARAIDLYLMGKSDLPTKEKGDLPKAH